MCYLHQNFRSFFRVKLSYISFKCIFFKRFKTISLYRCFFEEDIKKFVKKGVDVGCYRFQFDKKALPLKFNAWWTRFDFMFCRGGDQTLFVKKSVFNELKGFNPEYVIMEDFDFIRRARKHFKFKIIPKDVLVSARKYKHNSYFKVNAVNLWSYWTFMLGGSPERIKMNYKKWLKFES